MLLVVSVGIFHQWINPALCSLGMSPKPVLRRACIIPSYKFDSTGLGATVTNVGRKVRGKLQGRGRQEHPSKQGSRGDYDTCGYPIDDKVSSGGK